MGLSKEVRLFLKLVKVERKASVVVEAKEVCGTTRSIQKSIPASMLRVLGVLKILYGIIVCGNGYIISIFGGVWGGDNGNYDGED